MNVYQKAPIAITFVYFTIICGGDDGETRSTICIHHRHHKLIHTQCNGKVQTSQFLH